MQSRPGSFFLLVLVSIFSVLGWKYSLRLLLELAKADEANPKLATVKVMARAMEVWRFMVYLLR